MLKMRKSKFLKNMRIANRVTLLYGSMFSITIIVISAILWSNSSNINKSIVQNELLEAVSDIKTYIASTDNLTEEGMEEAIGNKSVFASVTIMNDFAKKDTMHIGIPKGAFENEDNIEHISNFPENDSNRPFEPFGMIRRDNEFRSVYIEENEYILMSVNYNIGNKEYKIDAFKMNIDSKYMEVLTIRLIIIDLVGIVIAFLLARYISHIMLKRVGNIRSTAERISVEDLSRRISIDGPDDEMKELSITFNSMIDRLENSFKSQTQFVSDASHELRTPISVIKGYASLINRWGKKDPEILQESIDSIISETDHMSQLVEKLLFLARGDRHSLDVNRSDICLNTVVSEVVKDIDVMETGKYVVFENIDEVFINADSNFIKQLLWIYTENAIKYTGENGKITFRVYKKDNKGYFEVCDNGIGIDESDIDKIFDRFYRADKSRNKDIAGTGLGLSIAKWIVSNNDGEIDVKSEKGKGTVFINSFPLVSRKEG